MIGYDIQSSARIVFAFDQKSQEHVLSAKLVFPSKCPILATNVISINLINSSFSGLFFDKYLKHIKLSEQFVHFTKMNLSYLLKVRITYVFILLCFSLMYICCFRITMIIRS